MYKNDPRVIHETILKDIVDVLSDVKDIDEIQFELGKSKSIKSIADATSNLTLVFPVVVSTDMDITSAMMISKAIERKCVAMLQMLLSAFQITDAKNAIDYISRFHTNMSMSDNMDFDKFVDYVDDFARKLDESSPIVVNRQKYDAIREDMKKNMNFYLNQDCINETSINDFKVLPTTINGERIVMREANHSDEYIRGAYDQAERRYEDYKRMAGDFAKQGTEFAKAMGKMAGSSSKKVTGNDRDRAATIKDRTEFLNKQVLSTQDIKKANELMPTTMVINFIVPGEDGGDAVQSYAVIGVKAKMYPVSSMDIVDRLRSKNKDNNGFNNFIRATTREISFWKDFVFAIEKAKLDALSSSRRGSSSPIWKLLERRALKSRIRRTFRMANDATAITTLVLSNNEVEWLKKNENMNILNRGTASAMMESYNLMGICVVDESIEVARFIFDTGEDDYESLTFSALERESSDTTYKRVVNLMTKMSR